MINICEPWEFAKNILATQPPRQQAPRKNQDKQQQRRKKMNENHLYSRWQCICSMSHSFIYNKKKCQVKEEGKTFSSHILTVKLLSLLIIRWRLRISTRQRNNNWLWWWNEFAIICVFCYRELFDTHVE